jgi:predicted PurR-regulated permease PerM
MAREPAPPGTPFDVTWLTLWRVGLFVLLAYIAVRSWQILLGLFLAIVISSGLEIIVTFLERRGIPRTVGVILVFLTAAVLVVVLIYTLIPIIIIDLNDAFDQLAKAGGNSILGPFISIKTAQSLSSFVNEVSARLLSSTESPLGILAQIVGGFALGVSVVVSSFYLSLTRHGVRRFFIAVIPAEYEQEVQDIYDRSLHRIGLWFRSQFLLSLIMGGFTMATLTFLGVKYALIVAIFTAVMELIPYIGPIIAGGLAVLAALITPGDGVQLAIYTLIAFLILHRIENDILVPILIGKGVGMHPVVVIVALLIGWEIAGILGVIVSIPAAVVLQEIVENWSSHKAQRQAVAAE